jgi:YggT family protein
MQSLAEILLFLLDIAWVVVLVHVVMSWLIGFQVLNRRQPLVARFWHGLNSVLEPVYGPVRRLLPATGGIDFAPLIVLVVLYALRVLVTNNLYAFA